VNRKVLLLEPNYGNKYPPVGLMKLATYHRIIGDEVRFYKGDLREFVINEIYDLSLLKLKDIDENVMWEEYRPVICEYIRTGRVTLLDTISDSTLFSTLATDVLRYYRNYHVKRTYYAEKKWDRVCITTLFTFHWKITIDTIEFAKQICNDIKQVWVGGILASVVPDDVEKATGVRPWCGQLDRPGILDDNDLVVENMSLDYSILDEIEYKYPEANAYYAYMTRGCIRNCDFCVVPLIEPDFVPYITLNHKIEVTADKYGEQKNLLLLDNNILASPDFSRIVEEIKSHGFKKGAKYNEPNWLDIAVKNLINGDNERAYLNRIHDLLIAFLKKLKNSQQQEFYNLLAENNMLKKYTVCKESVLKIYPIIRDVYEKNRSKTPKNRYVDFNQGIDARLINSDNIKLLSQLPVYPLRIAFDHWNERDYYEEAITLASKNGITHMSNYLLYNHDDKPIELYNRLKLNIDLCEKLKVNIYSFPMKYHPINDPDYFQNRDYIGEHWNKKFIRAVQSVLNSTKGKIGRGKSFFEAAFGKDEDEFFKILYMPEHMIIYRNDNQIKGNTDKWWSAFQKVKTQGNLDIIRLIETADFKNVDLNQLDIDSLSLIKNYLVGRKS